MASRAYEAQPLDVLLAAIPSLPRPLLARLTLRLVERLDALDMQDEDREDDDPAECNGDPEREGETWHEQAIRAAAYRPVYDHTAWQVRPQRP